MANPTATARLDGLDDDPEEALRNRPVRSIRTRIILSFLSLFVLCAAITAASFFMVTRIENSLRVLTICGNYVMELQQVRRFEKNYFLYGTDLGAALQNIRAAVTLLQRERASISAVLGAEDFGRMERDVTRYQDLMNELTGPARKDREEKTRIAADLRDHGSMMLSESMELLARERKQVAKMLRVSKQVPMGFLGLLFALILITTHFLTQQMLQPLNRFHSYTVRIARGDLSPIKPAKRYRDEFSDLAVAINLMLKQLKEHEEQLLQSRKMAAIGSLTSGIAHELNNPLNNIGLTVDTLLEDGGSLTPEERRRLLADISTQTDRAGATVRNLLDFTRMGGPTSARVDVRALAESTLKLVRHEMELGDLGSTLDIPDDLPHLIGDFGQLQQVFVNLLVNAIQATPPGGWIGISARPAGGEVEIEISDTGRGIPPEVVPNIFDPFFTTKEEGEGTGLGLSVSYGIVKKHGGGITVKPRQEGGTVFTLRLPRAEDAAPGEAST